MNEQIRQELTKLTGLIVEAVPVERIYLFGSHAYGTPHGDSDYDIYVVLNDDTPYRPMEAAQKIRRAVRGQQTRPMDIVTAKKSQFDARLSAITLEQEVAQQGVLLYG